MPKSEAGAAPSARMMYLAVAGAVGLMIAGGVAFYAATARNEANGEKGEGFRVAVTSSSCQPNEITVPGGKRSFEIHNLSERPVEWEILDGVMVVAERENIAPGFRQTLTANLVPGDYEITCGLLSNPRGVLHVTESEEARLAATDIGTRSFLGPLSEYKVYLVLQSGKAQRAAEELRQAIEAEDIERARTAWREARLAYRRVEPLAYRFSDLENAIDPVADYLEKREADPAFTGFHRIEYGLWAEKSTQGLAPVAARLAADIKELKARLGKARLDPALLISLPRDMAEQLGRDKILRGEDAYAHADTAELAASFEGIAKLSNLLRAVAKPVDPALDDEIGRKLEAIETSLAALETEEGYPSYDEVDEATRRKLSQEFLALADALGRLDSVIGVG